MEKNACRLIMSRIKTEFSRGADPAIAHAIARAMFERQLQADEHPRTVQDPADRTDVMSHLAN
jgi:hypothetical protein